MKVFKYDLNLGDLDDLNQITLRMPIGAEFLHIEVQDGVPRLWALVDPNRGSVPYTIEIVGTGHALSTLDDYRHIGTFLMHGGALVFHAFEVR